MNKILATDLHARDHSAIGLRLKTECGRRSPQVGLWESDGPVPCEPSRSGIPDAARAALKRKGKIMALYEHMLIARQDISAQAVDALATHLKTIIENEGGKVEKQEYWGLRTLAYRIKKNRKGHYVLLNLNAPAKAIAELERQLKINEDVLRFISVRVEAFEQSNSSRKREGSRDERRPRDENAPESTGAEA